MHTLGEAHETEVAGCRIAWSEMGDGPPLVLLHGILDSHRSWRRSAPALAKHFRVFMPDLPGHGVSGRPDAPYTLAWHSQVLSEWMQAIDLQDAHVCGHSYGAGIAMFMLLEHRERVRHLGLVSAGGLGRQVAPGMRLAAIPYFGKRLTPLALRHGLPRVLRYAAPTLGHMEPEEMEIMVRWARIPGTEMAFQRCIEGVINVFGQSMGAVERAGEVDELPPVAMFWGTKDTVIPVRHGRDTLDRLRGATLTTYSGCGHYPHLDYPQGFARDLSAFLMDSEREPAVFFQR